MSRVPPTTPSSSRAARPVHRVVERAVRILILMVCVGGLAVGVFAPAVADDSDGTSATTTTAPPTDDGTGTTTTTAPSPGDDGSGSTTTATTPPTTTPPTTTATTVAPGGDSMVGIAALCSSIGAVLNADGVTCDYNANTNIVANTTVTLDPGLSIHVQPGVIVTVNPGLTFDVTAPGSTGSWAGIVLDTGSGVVGDSATGIGATIALRASGGPFVLHGTAKITSNQSDTSCAGTEAAGPITLSALTTFTAEATSTVSATGVDCPGGNVSITSGGTTTLNGTVSSEVTSDEEAGDITVAAGANLVVGATAVVNASEAESGNTCAGSFVAGTIDLSATGSVSSAFGSLITASGTPCSGGTVEITAGTTASLAGAIDVTGNAAGAKGGSVTVTAGGNLDVGDGSNAIVVDASQNGGSCTGAGEGGAITMTSIVGSLHVLAAATLDSGSSKCSAGPIELQAGDTMTIDGSLLSQSGRTGDNSGGPGGGPITAVANCSLTVNGLVSSTGLDPGADLVHLEGCDVTITGTVESTGPGHSGVDNPENHCRSGEDGHPINSAGCIEVWAHGTLVITSTAELNADTGQAGGTTGNSWIDLFARNDITITGPAAGTVYAVHANGGVGVNTDIGGEVTVKSVSGTITTAGKALQGNATSSGSSGGSVDVQASGNVAFGTSSIQAAGASNGNGGTIVGRSFNGSVAGAAPGELNAAGHTPANGTVTLQSCTGVAYTGTSTPAFTTVGPTCGGSPSLPSYMDDFGDCACVGRIIVQKATVGGDATFTFTPSYNGGATFNLSNGQQNDSGGLAPGTHSVSESSIPAGWDLTSATCSDGSPVSAIGLVAAETVTCTFTNTKRGNIIVKKVTAGGDATFTFTPSYNGGATFGLSNGQQNDSGPLVPGTHSVSEAVVAGWGLTSATCDDGSLVSAIGLAAGETVTCTFTNTKHSNIIVKKITLPSSVQSFTFTTGGSGYPGFSLQNGQQSDSGPLVTGTYSVAETVPAGWDLTSATCDDGSLVSAIGLAAGETVTCTFTNTQRGHLVVKKVTQGGDGTFTFTGPSVPGGVPDVTTAGGTGQTSAIEVVPGNYPVTENLPAGWIFQTLICDDVQSANVSTVSGLQATFKVDPGETVTCTWTNAKRGAIIVRKVTQGGDGTFAFTTPDVPGGIPNVTTTAGTGQTSAIAVDPGAYHVTETLPAGWQFVSLACNDLDAEVAIASPSSVNGMQATYNVDPGETVTCTWTNLKVGSITIVKDTRPDSATSFAFGATGGASPTSFSLVGNGAGSANTQVLSNLVNNGTYVLSEAVRTDYSNTAITCTGGSSNVVDLAAQRVTITFHAGDTIVCTFVNEPITVGGIIAFTGVNSWQWAFGGLAALLVGSVFLLIGRRRRTVFEAS